MKEPIDLNEYKRNKQRREKEKNDLKIFQEIISKPMKDLTPEQQRVYNEVGVLCSFDFKEIHRVVLVIFRDVYYLLNILNDGVFEYIGKMDDIIDLYINSIQR